MKVTKNITIEQIVNHCYQFCNRSVAKTYPEVKYVATEIFSIRHNLIKNGSLEREELKSILHIYHSSRFIPCWSMKDKFELPEIHIRKVDSEVNEDEIVFQKVEEYKDVKPHTDFELSSSHYGETLDDLYKKIEHETFGIDAWYGYIPCESYVVKREEPYDLLF